jgi:hypothetical protein
VAEGPVIAIHQDDAVLVAEPAQCLQELGRRDVETALAHHRLDDDRGHARRLDVVLEDVLECIQAVLDADAVIRDRERRVKPRRGTGEAAL